MLSAKRHNELVDFMMESDRFQTRKELEDEMIRRFGDISFDDFDKAMADAADRERERAADLDAEAEAMAEYMPLFDGEPKDAKLGEVAIRKAALGDPLALKFLTSLQDDDL